MQYEVYAGICRDSLERRHQTTVGSRVTSSGKNQSMVVKAIIKKLRVVFLTDSAHAVDKSVFTGRQQSTELSVVGVTVRPSICLSVCVPRAAVVSKRRKLGS